MAYILICDDDEAMRNFVSRALELDGHSTKQAFDGANALDVMAEESEAFDLLLTDIRMPVMDGFELALKTVDLHPKTTILMMTGFADQRETALDLEAAVYDIVTKPFSLAQIRSKVSEALASRQAQAA